MCIRDRILSGVNRGNNSADNALYSGTIGAAIEGTIHKIKSIALSQYLGPRNIKNKDPFEAANYYGAEIIKKLLKHNEWGTGDYRVFYNVNFPPVGAKEVLGSKLTPLGFRENSSFSVEPSLSPGGKRFLWIKGGPQDIPTKENTDAAVNLNGFISITPMSTDLTDYSSLEKLIKKFKQHDT